MPDPVIPTAAPETSPTPAQPTPAAPVVPATPATPTPTPAETDRAALYRRYYDTQVATQPVAPAVPAVDPAAPVEPAPTAPVEPAPAAADPIAERLAAIDAMLAKLAQVPTVAQPPAAEPPVAQPAPTPGNDDWLALLQQGKIAEAETVMANKFSAKAKEEAITQALDLFRVETQITDFLTNLRGENQDLLPLEGLIAVNAQRMLEAASTAGRIRSTADYVEQYKAAVNAATAEARKLYQQIRAAGKDEALTSKREVLASSTIPPSPVADRGTPATPAEPQPHTASDYLAERQARSARQRGMST
jgi:hypothetical protein